MKKSKLSVQDMGTIGLCTSIIAILAQITIPMPTGVPLTLQTFAIVLTSAILGKKSGALAAFLYVALGAIGAPVLAGFKGGLQNLVGPTGGFLWSFPLMAYLVGLGAEKYYSAKSTFLLFLTLGTVINYAVGVLVFCLSTQSGIKTGITVCVIPFIPTSVIQIILASSMGIKLKARLAMIL